MPTWLIITLCIIAFLAIIVTIIIKSHLNIHIVYDGQIRAYAQFLFLKIKLFKKHKYLKERIRSYQESDLPAEKIKENDNLFYDDIIDLIEEFRDLIQIFSEYLIDCMVFKVVSLDIDVAGENAMSTTFAHNAVMQSVSYFLTYIDEISNVEIPYYKNINILPNYISKKSHFNTSIIISLPLLKALKRLYMYV